jgi:hypothetical protein
MGIAASVWVVVGAILGAVVGSAITAIFSAKAARQAERSRHAEEDAKRMRRLETQLGALWLRVFGDPPRGDDD